MSRDIGWEGADQLRKILVGVVGEVAWPQELMVEVIWADGVWDDLRKERGGDSGRRDGAGGGGGTRRGLSAAAGVQRNRSGHRTPGKQQQQQQQFGLLCCGVEWSRGCWVLVEVVHPVKGEPRLVGSLCVGWVVMSKRRRRAGVGSSNSLLTQAGRCFVAESNKPTPQTVSSKNTSTRARGQTGERNGEAGTERRRDGR